MFAHDLALRQKKFEKESRELILKEKKRLVSERRERERAQKLKEEFEENLRLKRIAEAEAEEAERKRKDGLRETNRGIFFEKWLRAIPLPESYMKERGIKRGNDKILLPPSLSSELMSQHASKNGALLFEIKTDEGKVTHAGFLDSTAEEGTVGLPVKVVNSLFGSSQQCQGEVSVCYKRLEIGTYVRLQPLKYGFHELVGDAMSDVLEEVMKTYSTLTINDIIDIDINGDIHKLKVVELEPDNCVSIISTDLAVDVILSEEVEEKLNAAQEAMKLKHEQIKREEEEKNKKIKEGVRQEEERLKLISSILAALPEEVSIDCGEKTILTLVRFPNGSMIQRRFKITDSIQKLFDYIDSQGAGGYWPGAYQIVSQFPRRIFNDTNMTFEELGLSSSQEAFLLEAKNTN